MAVYDLGGGTFDTAVLQRQDRRFAVVGPPNGREGLGGEVFDQRLFDWVGARLAEDAPELWQRLRDSDERAWRHARGQLRSDVRRAKETLSRDEWAPVYVAHPVDRELRVTRREFEDLIRADVEESVEILRRTIEGAGLQLGDLAGLYLTGGSSRIPLVANLLQAEIGRADTRDDPKTVVALGALEVAAARRPPTSSPPPPPPEDPVEPVTVPSPWWRRTPVIVGVLLALLLLGGMTFAAVTQDGDGDGDGEQTQTISERPGTTDTAPPGTTDAPPPETTDGPPAQDDGEPSADEQALSALLPPAAKDCEAGEPAEDATAEFVCDVAGYTVTYTSFPSPTEMDAWFDEGEDPPPGEGGCGGEWPSSGTWHFSATPSGENEGRVKCYDDEEGDSVIEWTEDRHSVHGFMYADGVDHEGLHAAWEERAGLAE